MNPATIHASAVLFGETGILVRGPSGSGKSSLVLGLLDAEPERSRLVADDRVILTPAHGRLLADAPDALAGLIEMRGVGILRRPFVAPIVLGLVVDLAPPQDCPRLPDASETSLAIAGITLPRLILPIGGGDLVTRVRAAARGEICLV